MQCTNQTCQSKELSCVKNFTHKCITLERDHVFLFPFIHYPHVTNLIAVAAITCFLSMTTHPDWKIPEKENRVREFCGQGEIASHCTNRTRRSKELSCVKNFTSKRISLERDRV